MQQSFFWFARILLCVMFVLLLTNTVTAQNTGSYNIKDGKMLIQINKASSDAEIDSFISRFDLTDLPLKYFLKTGKSDSLQRLGWKVESNSKRSFVVSKPLNSLNDAGNPADKIIFTGKNPVVSELFPVNVKPVPFGINRFRNNQYFATSGNVVTFILRHHLNAKRVMLAGTFNSWSPTSMPMTKTDSGWIARVKLENGKHWYKFIVDGRWDLDPDNLNREGDGRGNINSFYFKTNHLFRLNTAAYKKVFVAGSFNNWNRTQIPLQRTSSGWALPIYLSDGTHTYKFVADGQWLQDPNNSKRLPDGVNSFNSVVAIGRPHVFRLPGYTNAQRVLLTGSFNGWRKDELLMNKTSTGWELPYVVAEGNHEYRFVVDRKEIIDPNNPLVTNGGRGNSFLIVNPNHTFRLKGYPNAKRVVITGDFSNWDPQLLVMKKLGDDWILPVHLSFGKHLYKFVVDGNWIRDPNNKLWEQNEFGTGNSVIWMREY